MNLVLVMLESTIALELFHAHLIWLFPFIYRRYQLPIWATPPEDG